MAATVASVANLVRKLLPFKRPWRFIFGDQGRGALGMQQPAHCPWDRLVAEPVQCDVLCRSSHKAGHAVGGEVGLR